MHVLGSSRQADPGPAREIGDSRISNDGKLLASACFDGTVILWNVATFEECAKLSHTGALAWSLTFKPKSSLLASAHGTETGRVGIWDIDSGRLIATYYGEPATYSPQSLNTCIDALAYSPNGTWLAYGGVCPLTLADAQDSTRKTRLLGHSSTITSVAFSPVSRLIASGSADRSIKLWEVATGKERASLDGHKDIVTSVDFHNGGVYLAAGCANKTVTIWDTLLQKPVAQLMDHIDVVQCVKYSANGNLLASGSWDATIILWALGAKARPKR
jgi:WD40 repeat protein